MLTKSSLLIEQDEAYRLHGISDSHRLSDLYEVSFQKSFKLSHPLTSVMMEYCRDAFDFPQQKDGSDRKAENFAHAFKKFVRGSLYHYF